MYTYDAEHSNSNDKLWAINFAIYLLILPKLQAIGYITSICTVGEPSKCCAHNIIVSA